MSDERFDQLLSEALHDVPVPVGLAERILAARESCEPTAEVSLPHERAASPRSKWQFSRRQWLLVGGSLGLAAVIGVCVIQFLSGRSRSISQQELAGDVTACIDGLRTANWHPAAAGLPNGVVLDPSVSVTPRQWLTLPVPHSAGWSGSVTAIDLARPGQERAVLFVVRSSATFAVQDTPTPTALLSITGGYKATAWQTRGLLFVLVVKERGRLEDFLRKAPEA